jgi:hypothetical protein
MVYQLFNSGAISSILIHKPGSVRGVRLAKLAKEQKDEGFVRAVAKEYNTGRKPRLTSTEQRAPGKKRGRHHEEHTP